MDVQVVEVREVFSARLATLFEGVFFRFVRPLVASVFYEGVEGGLADAAGVRFRCGIGGGASGIFVNT